MSKQLPPAPTASAIGPCPTMIQIVGGPGTGIYPGPLHHPAPCPIPLVHYCIVKTKFSIFWTIMVMIFQVFQFLEF